VGREDVRTRLPGDLGAYMNPDYSPGNSAYVNENFVQLVSPPSGTEYYAHPFGLTSGPAIVAALKARSLTGNVYMDPRYESFDFPAIMAWKKK